MIPELQQLCAGTNIELEVIDPLIDCNEYSPYLLADLLELITAADCLIIVSTVALVLKPVAVLPWQQVRAMYSAGGDESRGIRGGSSSCSRGFTR